MQPDFPCFPSLAAVVVVSVDKVEIFQVFEVVADSTVAELVLVVRLGELLVSLIDVAGLNLVLFSIEFFDGLVEEVVVFCEVVEDLGGVLLTGLLLGSLDLVFGDNGVLGGFGAGFQPLEGEADVLGC